MELDLRIICLSFEIAKPGSAILWQILKCVPVENYTWYNIASQDEAWRKDMDLPLFQKYCYRGEEFKVQIQQPQFVIFSKLQAYSNPPRKMHNLCSLQDFRESDCDLLLLIYDCTFVEIYAKDPTILSLLYQNALDQGYTGIACDTEETCRRTNMNIR